MLSPIESQSYYTAIAQGYLPDHISTLTTARDPKNGLRPPERLVRHQPRDEDAFGAHGVR